MQRSAGALYLVDYGDHVHRVPICVGDVAFYCGLASFSELRASKLHAARLCGRYGSP